MPLSILEVLLAPTAELAKGVVADVSVEAEYGAIVMEGSVLTLAHHQPDGPYSTKGGARAPCCAQALIADYATQLKAVLDRKPKVTILVSHLDLDTIGGIGRVLAVLTNQAGDMIMFENYGNVKFWNIAEFVDLNGPHRVTKAPDYNDEDEIHLHAFWAHTRDRGRTRFDQDKVTDVTYYVEEALMSLNQLLVPSMIPDVRDHMLKRGHEHFMEQERLDKQSLVEDRSGVLVRCHAGFVNHLYGADGKAVVAFNPEAGSITISLADPVPGVSCRALMQELFGPEAGGHDGIAGSPRGKRMTFEGWGDAVELVEFKLSVKG